MTIVAQRLAPNPTATPNSTNIASGKTDDPTFGSSLKIQIGSSLQGVVDVNISNTGLAGRSGGDGPGDTIAGRASTGISNRSTAFNFNQAQIVVIQAADVLPPFAASDVLAQRMLAIGQNEVDATAASAIVAPTDRTLQISSFKATFNFAAKGVRKDTLSMKLSLQLPGGIDFTNHPPPIYAGIGNALLLFQIAKGKGSMMALPAGQSPVNTTGTTLTLSNLPKKALSVAGTIATCTISMTSDDLVSNGFKFLGITNADNPGQPVMVECLMVVEGVPYRQTFQAMYTSKKGKGVLSK